jgi:hypothetical protein
LAHGLPYRETESDGPRPLKTDRSTSEELDNLNGGIAMKYIVLSNLGLIVTLLALFGKSVWGKSVW